MSGTWHGTYGFTIWAQKCDSEGSNSHGGTFTGINRHKTQQMRVKKKKKGGSQEDQAKEHRRSSRTIQGEFKAPVGPQGWMNKGENQSLVAILQPSVYLQAVLTKLIVQWGCVVVLFTTAAPLVSYLEFMNHQVRESYFRL